MLNTDKWIKYSYVCPDCDSLIEYTCSDKFGFPSGSVMNITCPCGRVPNLLSATDATIQPNEGDKMQEVIVAPNETDGQIDFLKTRVEKLTEAVNRANSQLGKIIDNLTEDYWYSDSTDKDEVLSELCDIIGHNPTKEICFTATIRFNGRIDVPLSEVAEFSISDAISDAYVDVNNGDIVIDDYDIEEVSEEY